MKTKSGVNLGISLPYSFPDARIDHAYIRRFVRHAEALGFDDGWLTEGILNPNFVLEPVTYIAHLAALTEKIRFGISVIILNYRNPIQLAKQLATVDHLSNGRLTVGFGLGGGTSLYPAFGIGPEKRVTRFEEAMKVMTALWTQERVTHRRAILEAQQPGHAAAPLAEAAHTRVPRRTLGAGDAPRHQAGRWLDGGRLHRQRGIARRSRSDARLPRGSRCRSQALLAFQTHLHRGGGRRGEGPREAERRPQLSIRGARSERRRAGRDAVERPWNGSGASSKRGSTTSCSTPATSMRARWRFWPQRSCRSFRDRSLVRGRAGKGTAS